MMNDDDDEKDIISFYLLTPILSCFALCGLKISNVQSEIK